MRKIDLLYAREALKIEILANRPKVMTFIKNSYQLWFAAQFNQHDASDAFYGSGNVYQVLGRQLARKDCMSAWRKAKATGKTIYLVEHVATVLNYTRELAMNVQDVNKANSAYDALVEFQTPGFINPLNDDDYDFIHKFVKEQQIDQSSSYDCPDVPIAIHNHIIARMIDIAGLDMNKVEILYDVAHPACLGYGGVEKGVKLGISHDPNMTPFKNILTNWHEIGHAAYRQSIPYGHFVAGRAMDEAMAFLNEYWVGYSEDFLQFLLDEGLRHCGYNMQILKASAGAIIRDTKRIETNPVRHIIDINLCEQLERALVNEDIDGEDAEIFWSKIIEAYADILPKDYPYYYDVHMMSGIYGDRACYTPGLLAAMQIGQSKSVTFDNISNHVRDIALSGYSRFDDAVHMITSTPLSKDAFMAWMDKMFI